MILLPCSSSSSHFLATDLAPPTSSEWKQFVHLGMFFPLYWYRQYRPADLQKGSAAQNDIFFRICSMGQIMHVADHQTLIRFSRHWTQICCVDDGSICWPFSIGPYERKLDFPFCITSLCRGIHGFILLVCYETSVSEAVVPYLSRVHRYVRFSSLRMSVFFKTATLHGMQYSSIPFLAYNLHQTSRYDFLVSCWWLFRYRFFLSVC